MHNADRCTPSATFSTYALLPVLRQLGLQTKISQSAFVKLIEKAAEEMDLVQANKLWNYLGAHWFDFNTISSCGMGFGTFQSYIKKIKWIPATFKGQEKLGDAESCRPYKDMDLVATVKYILEDKKVEQGVLETMGWNRPVPTSWVIQHLQNISTSEEKDIRVLHNIYSFLNDTSDSVADMDKYSLLSVKA